jgi:hypothetical protein
VGPRVSLDVWKSLEAVVIVRDVLQKDGHDQLDRPCVRNEEAGQVHGAKGERNVLHTVKRKKVK